MSSGESVQSSSQEAPIGAAESRVDGQVLAVRNHRTIDFLVVGIPGVEETQIAVQHPDRTKEEAATAADDYKVGDLVSAAGQFGETEASKRRGLGQMTLFADGISVVASNDLPRWSGADIPEQLTRQAEHTTMLVERAATRKAIRGLLDNNEYLELETSILQRNPSGAAARTFDTVTNFDGETRHLRIAPEVDLKWEMARTGIGRVYELGRNFRNEGVSATHHPEFTNLEVYTAGMQQGEAVDLSLELLAKIAEPLQTVDPIDFNTAEVLDYADLFMHHLGLDLHTISQLEPEQQTAHLRQYLNRNHVHDPAFAELQASGILDALFKKVVRPTILGMTVVKGYLSRQMPLAATLPDQPEIVDGFQVLFQGSEIVKAYNELTNADQLSKNLAAQAGEAEEDAVATDPRLIDACRMGLPQMYGIGIGLDRFHALATGRRIEQVIPVPVK